jgi:hypothetical protein
MHVVKVKVRDKGPNPILYTIALLTLSLIAMSEDDFPCLLSLEV